MINLINFKFKIQSKNGELLKNMSPFYTELSDNITFKDIQYDILPTQKLETKFIEELDV